MAEITLYNHELDENCYKVRLALSLLGRKWRTIAVNAYPGNEPATLPFLAMNPLGTLPVLKDGALTLHGAEAILAHLARSYDPAGKWLPSEGADFAGVMQWLVFSAGALAVAVEARRNSVFEAPGDADAMRRSAGRMLRIMDDHMISRGFEGADWFAAGHATIADIALFPAFALSRDFGIDHDEYAGLRRWERRMRALPGFITMPGIPSYH
jgi:glutathione S-transferase